MTPDLGRRKARLVLAPPNWGMGRASNSLVYSEQFRSVHGTRRALYGSLNGAVNRLWRGRFNMRRREFITLLGGATVVWPLEARTQQPKVARIGALYIGLADAESFRKELREGLREVGYVEGHNIAFEFRSAEGRLDRLSELASELVRLKVDVIVALYVPCALAAKQATREIPIVIIAADPVETGIVASLARPGGSITGVSLMSARS